MHVNLEFSGGMELLFDNKPYLKVDLPETVCSIGDLLPYVRDNILVGKPELFMLNQTIRPGVLILINDVDWELEGDLEYVLQEDDKIIFISTLHGG